MVKPGIRICCIRDHYRSYCANYEVVYTAGSMSKTEVIIIMKKIIGGIYILLLFGCNISENDRLKRKTAKKYDRVIHEAIAINYPINQDSIHKLIFQTLKDKPAIAYQHLQKLDSTVRSIQLHIK